MSELENKIKAKLENGEVAESDEFDIDSDFDLDSLNLD